MTERLTQPELDAIRAVMLDQDSGPRMIRSLGHDLLAALVAERHLVLVAARSARLNYELALDELDELKSQIDLTQAALAGERATTTTLRAALADLISWFSVETSTEADEHRLAEAQVVLDAAGESQ